MSAHTQWCRIVEHDGNTVLMTRGYDPNTMLPQMVTTFVLDHFATTDTQYGEIHVTATRSDGEEFTTEEWDEYCQASAVADRVDLAVANVLKANQAMN